MKVSTCFLVMLRSGLYRDDLTILRTYRLACIEELSSFASQTMKSFMWQENDDTLSFAGLFLQYL